AVFTPFMGLIYQGAHSMALAMALPLGCYLVVAYFGFWGCQIAPRERRWSQGEWKALEQEE
ncbi:MAG TPA: hypothetical protein VFE01_01260, partial [Terracidiphilus sp.]|nr:hypothetical protein [Terracidiphilus sp.]